MIFPWIEVGRFYGGGTKYKSVYYRMTRIQGYAKLLSNAVANGDDPINVSINEALPAGKLKSQGRAAVFRSFAHYTLHAHVSRCLKLFEFRTYAFPLVAPVD